MGKPSRALHKLTDAEAKSGYLKPGRHSDGGGLYLNVTPAGTKSWVFMWSPPGRARREMGLGAYPATTLAVARAKASESRAAVAQGRDPLAERRQVAEPTFAEATAQYIESIKGEWRNEKHAYQWGQTLGDSYCRSIRQKRVSEITTEDVVKVLTPIWSTKSETASRLRGRIERVLDFCRTKGWRSGENPAAWRGHLRHILPKRSKLTRGHHPAMPYAKVPAFIVQLRQAEGLGARALEICILTATRSGEILGADWSEIDLAAAAWTISGERTKTGKTHVVPLAPRAIEILRQLEETKISEWVFPGTAKGRPLSNMAMMMTMRRLGVGDLTVHGFRSSFRDWAGDETSFPRDVAEMALAHKVGDETEQAYRRGSALEKRRKLMTAWGDYCGTAKGGNVIPLARAKMTIGE